MDFPRPLAWLLILAFAPAAARAKVYYVNKGVKYHIGDTRFSRSTDAAFLGSHPVVGQEWVQAFSVDRVDKVKVRIERVWGVDACDYCLSLVQIDDWTMGRLYPRDNEKGFETLEPLAKRVEPGQIHYLRISTAGLQADDFAIENVIVETQHAELTLFEPGPVVKDPGEPMPRVYPPRPQPRQAGPCESLKVHRDWMLPWKAGGAPPVVLDAPQRQFAQAGPLVELRAGEAVELDLQAGRILSTDAVSQPVEILAGGGPFDGWAMLLGPSGAFQHGNLVLQGDYTAEAFQAEGFRPGAWNRLKIEYCGSGELRLAVNGRRLGQGIRARQERMGILVRAMGMRLDIRAVSAPEAQPGPEVPAAPEPD